MSIKDLQNKWHDLTHLVMGGGLTFLMALEQQIEASGGKVLQDAAANAVAAAEAAGGSGEDKFKAAFEAVVATLTAEGIPVIVNAVKGAIEAAVANMKAS